MSKQVKRDQENLLNALAKLGGKLTAEEDVIFQGRQLVIPEKMDLNDAIKFLEKKRDEDVDEMVFARIF
jgi:hypothetical protein